MRSLTEWLLALVVLAGVVWVGGPVMRRWVPVPTGTVTLVESELPALPTGVPAGSASEPLVILPDGAEVRVGMSEAAVQASSLHEYQAGTPIVEPGVIGNRVILPYRAGRTAFWVVLDRVERGRDPRVTAIYVR
ncbi:MAG: hypothetical protein R2712_19705 [Vicinamibacterales bacterium]